MSIDVRDVFEILLTASVLFAGVAAALDDGGLGTTHAVGLPGTGVTCERSCCARRRGEAPLPTDDRHDEQDDCPVCRFAAAVWSMTSTAEIAGPSEAVACEFSHAAENPAPITIRRCPARGPPRC